MGYFSAIKAAASFAYSYVPDSTKTWINSEVKSGVGYVVDYMLPAGSSSARGSQSGEVTMEKKK